MHHQPFCLTQKEQHNLWKILRLSLPQTRPFTSLESVYSAFLLLSLLKERTLCISRLLYDFSVVSMMIPYTHRGREKDALGLLLTIPCSIRERMSLSTSSEFFQSQTLHSVNLYALLRVHYVSSNRDTSTLGHIFLQHLVISC